MKANEQTIDKIARALKKTAARFAQNPETEAELTDIHLQVKQDSGELLVFDDKGEELHRCVIDEWIGNQDEDFYDKIQPVIKRVINAHKDMVSTMNVLKPYSLVLTDDGGETVAELFLADDELVILDGELMQGLDEELDAFLASLFKED